MDKVNRLYKEWRFFFIFLFLMSVFRSAVADWYTVPTGSMKPSILEGDRIYVNKMAYGLRVPFTTIPVVKWSQSARGDVVVFMSDTASKRLVKRVIGLPGDVVQLVSNRLYINGEPATYQKSMKKYQALSWDSESRNNLLLSEKINGFQHSVAISRVDSDFGPVSVPEGQLFVLGDNRDRSADSRYIGFVPMSELLGKAIAVIVSLDENNYYLPRKDRYFIPFEEGG